MQTLTSEELLVFEEYLRNPKASGLSKSKAKKTLDNSDPVVDDGNVVQELEVETSKPFDAEDSDSGEEDSDDDDEDSEDEEPQAVVQSRVQKPVQEEEDSSEEEDDDDSDDDEDSDWLSWTQIIINHLTYLIV